MKNIGIMILFMLGCVTLMALFYEEPKSYTYYLNNKFGKSNDCYISKSDYRICNVKGHYKVVELYYEEL